MISKLALLTNLFVAFVALAIPSPELDAIPVRRQDLESRAGVPTSDSRIEYTPNLGGAAQNATNGVLTFVTGTFVIPTLSSTLTRGIIGFAGATWISLDRIPECGTGALQVGVTTRIIDGEEEIIHDAWYEWIPEPRQSVGLHPKAGDEIEISITTTSSKSATVAINNKATGEHATVDLATDFALCGAHAQWIHEVSLLRGFPGTKVTFTNTVASTGSGPIPSGYTVINAKIPGGDWPLMSVQTAGQDIIIEQIN